MFKFLSNMVVNWLSYERPSNSLPLCDFERIRYELRPCDVLLIEGRSRVSEVIKQVTQSSWSHSALYIGRIHDIEDPQLRERCLEFYKGPPEAQLLIEGMMGQGTIINPITFYKDDHIRICRPRGLSPIDAQKVINYSIRKLGSDYDVKRILDLLRFMFPWGIMPKKWRSMLFSKTAGKSTKTICSTMIAGAFTSVEFPVLPYVKKNSQTGIELIQRNPGLYTPRDFDYSPYFEIIKYPFIEFDNPAYRNLPWNREGLMSHDNEHFTENEHIPTQNYSPDQQKGTEDPEFPMK